MERGNSEKIIGITASLLLGGVVAFSINFFTAEPILETTSRLPIKSTDSLAEILNSNDVYLVSGNPFGTFDKKALNALIVKKPKPPKSDKLKAAGEEKNALKVVGVLAPDLAVVTKDNKTITLKSNSNSSVGYVGNITARGVYIDGKFLEMM